MASEEEKRIFTEQLLLRLKAYEASRKTESPYDDIRQFDLLAEEIEVAKAKGVSLEFDYKTYNTPESLIENLRMQLDQRRMTSKIQDARCKCGKGKMGRIGKRDANSGLMDVKLRRGGNVKCHDIGIGQAAEGTEVIAFVPPKTQTGFVDYKK